MRRRLNTEMIICAHENISTLNTPSSYFSWKIIWRSGKRENSVGFIVVASF